MSVKKILIYTLLITCGILRGQNFSSGPGITDTVTYESTGNRVPVFVFNAETDNPDVLGDLMVNAPSDTSDFNFNWYRYDTLSKAFVTFSTPGYGIASAKNNLEEGGYRVIITHSSGYADTLDSWVFINNFDCTIKKDLNGQILKNKIYCDVMYLETNAHFDTLVYFDPTDSSKHLLISEPGEIIWTFDTEDNDFTGFSGDRSKMNPTVSSPPAEDAIFYLDVTDKYGAEASDQAEYIAIRVKAKYDLDALLVTEREPLEFYENYYTDDGDSLTVPQEIIFYNESSSKATHYFWRFGDDSTSVKKDSIHHTYLFPGEYEVVLIVNNELCSDSTIDDNIKIIDLTADPEIKVPNVFHIYGENRFRVYDKHITAFEILIFTRYGQKVHHFKGNDIKEWQGWDGKINNSDRLAKTGVYYYIIKTAVAFNNAKQEVKFDKDEVLSGFFMYLMTAISLFNFLYIINKKACLKAGFLFL